MSDPSMADDVKGEVPEPESAVRGRGQYGYPTLRDQFAMAAMPALMKLYGNELVNEDIFFDDIARDAYNCADSMLEAREFVEEDEDNAVEE